MSDTKSNGEIMADALCLSTDSLYELIICCESEIQRRRNIATPPVPQILTPPKSPAGRQYIDFNSHYRIKRFGGIPSDPDEDEEDIVLPSPEVYTALPAEWKFSLPQTEHTIATLNNYDPVKCSDMQMNRQISIFLALLDQTHRPEHKALVFGKFFTFLAVNKSFVKKHPRFHKVIAKQLEEFESDQYDKIRDIARDFAWMKDAKMTRPDAHVSAGRSDPTPDHYSSLPRWMTGDTTFEDAKYVLEHFEPVKYDKLGVTSQIAILITMCKNVGRNGVEKRAFIGRQMFRLLEVNLWFIVEHEKFRQVIINKLHEFMADSEKEANELAGDYAWMMDHPYPQCRYCREYGKCVVQDGEDKFCSQEHLELYSENGDCPHDPTITTKQLDEELDDYNAQQPVHPADGPITRKMVMKAITETESRADEYFSQGAHIENIFKYITEKCNIPNVTLESLKQLLSEMVKEQQLIMVKEFYCLNVCQGVMRDEDLATQRRVNVVDFSKPKLNDAEEEDAMPPLVEIEENGGDTLKWVKLSKP